MVKKSILSWPPQTPKLANGKKSALSRPPQTTKLETVKNRFFQDHHKLPT